MHRIYQNIILTVGASCLLDKPASQHLLKVLRLRVGERVIVFNGEGGEFEAELVSTAGGVAQLRVIEFIDIQREPELKVHLGQCLSRGERMDYAIQKSVEVGVAEITPLFSKRSTVKLSQERLLKRMRHWQQVIISACEQSGRTILPILHEPKPLAEWIAQCEGVSFICDVKPNVNNNHQFKAANLLIGPEGGFDPLEIQLAYDHNFQSLYLGKLTLRTETAPVVAITQLIASKMYS